MRGGGVASVTSIVGLLCALDGDRNTELTFTPSGDDCCLFASMGARKRRERLRLYVQIAFALVRSRSLNSFTLCQCPSELLVFIVEALKYNMVLQQFEVVVHGDDVNIET